MKQTAKLSKLQKRILTDLTFRREQYARLEKEKKETGADHPLSEYVEATDLIAMYDDNGDPDVNIFTLTSEEFIQRTKVIKRALKALARRGLVDLCEMKSDPDHRKVSTLLAKRYGLRARGGADHWRLAAKLTD